VHCCACIEGEAVSIKDICKTFRKRAATWEREQGELGKIVASEIRCVVDVFEEHLHNQAEPGDRLGRKHKAGSGIPD
jgi:hypothetical protein